MKRTSALVGTVLILLVAGAASGADYKDVHKVMPIDASGRVTIDAHNGTITVTPWNQPNVSVDARIEPAEHFADSGDVQKTEVRVTGGGREVNIESDYSAVPSHVTLFGIQQSYPPIHYTIHMPATAQLRVKAHNAAVKATALKSDVDVETHNGSVDLLDVDGGAKVETHNGSVRVVFANVTRPTSIETHNGSVDVEVPANARMTVNVDSHRSGAFSTSLPATVKSSGSTATSLINGGGPELRFRTHNGSLQLSKR